MEIAFFYHSLVSDWDNGSAHFLRGIASELLAQGHGVRIFEERDNWSTRRLIRHHGEAGLKEFRKFFPGLHSVQYTWDTLDLDESLDGVDLVLVHEWNPSELVNALGRHRIRSGNYRLLFHDSGHHSVSRPRALANNEFSGYDGVLVFGKELEEIYRVRGWHDFIRVWHEAADVRVFQPMDSYVRDADLVYVGNWGEGERDEELSSYLMAPVKELGISAWVYGAKYPGDEKRQFQRSGIHHAGWMPNYRIPEVFSRFGLTVHIPRRYYTDTLPGIPTIRPFEAMACRIPLVSAPWDDVDGLFCAGRDYLPARNPKEMREHIRLLLEDRSFAEVLSWNAYRTITQKHTCRHRVEDLLRIAAELGTSALRDRTGISMAMQ